MIYPYNRILCNQKKSGFSHYIQWNNLQNMLNEIRKMQNTACCLLTIGKKKWLMPGILSTQEAEIKRIVVQSQPGQIVLETLSQKNP
jgi:hypothetical protein